MCYKDLKPSNYLDVSFKYILFRLSFFGEFLFPYLEVSRRSTLSEAMRHSRSSLVFLFLSFLPFVLSDDISCSSTNPCTEGCCSKLSNVCGYGPSYCSSTNCIAAASTNGTCSQLAECDPGVYPGWGDNWGMSHFGLKYICNIVRFYLTFFATLIQVLSMLVLRIAL